MLQPHGGSLRANGPATAPSTPSPTRAPSVRNTAGGFRPAAQAHAQPHGGSLRANGPATAPPPPSPARAPSVGNAAGGFRPAAQPHAQPHGGSLRANGRCHRSVNAHASARTFGAKRRRGLPPNRSAACFSRMAAACGQTALPPPRQRPRQRAHLRCETQPGASAQPLRRMLQPHGGSLRANGPATAPSTPSPARAPSVRNAAGGFRPAAQPHAQPHGGSLRANGRCHRSVNAHASARTFGAKHSRGLPPNRSAAEV